MSEPRPFAAPFANVWALDDGGEPISPEDRQDIDWHRYQNELFDAGAYDEDEQERFVKMGRDK